ncbi:uncharacterized protein MKZ38_005369 [Zalerion maritima]|uniref:Developmental regulator protein n=1 Tax=Zalerion maritima TaxID=339359 RepID=A0AAD5RW75_9PEZI|nr:uncharacterized protein MKZ38_005369 [Zalerion maritima]
MPTYLCHGFRWSRRNVRVYVVVQNLDDAAPEWVIKPGSSKCVLESFYTLFDFLPSCAPPGNEKLQYRRAFNHANYYKLYNGPPDVGRGQGMGEHLSGQRSRSQGTARRLPHQDDSRGEEGGAGAKGWWGRERTYVHNTHGHGHSQSYSQNSGIGGGGGDTKGEKDWERRQQYYHLTPGKPRSQSESRVVTTMPNANQPHTQRQNRYQRNQSHSRTRGARNGPPSIASSASSTTLGATSHPSSIQRTKAKLDAPLPPPPSPPPGDAILQNGWSVVQLLEEYSPSSSQLESMPSQEYCYVSDYVVKLDLSVGVVEQMARYEERQRAGDGAMKRDGPSDETRGRASSGGGADGSRNSKGWFEKLRDQLQRGEDIKWYVVICEDEERNSGLGRKSVGYDDDGQTIESYESTEFLEGGSTTNENSSWNGEQDDYERRRRMLQMQFGRPLDNPELYAEEEEEEEEEEEKAKVSVSVWGTKREQEQERDGARGLEREKERRTRLFRMQVENPPKVPKKDYPPIAKKNMDVGDPREKPKTPKGGIRRLFSRGRLVDDKGFPG